MLAVTFEWEFQVGGPGGTPLLPVTIFGLRWLLYRLGEKWEPFSDSRYSGTW